MNKKIIEALKPLKIDVEFLEYTGKKSEYIIFATRGDKEDFFSDDDNEIYRGTITLNYWYKNSSGYSNINKIIKLMKNAGFFMVDSTDLKENGFFGKNFIFNYIEFKEERGI